jgi:hypothetical protein
MLCFWILTGGWRERNKSWKALELLLHMWRNHCEEIRIMQWIIRHEFTKWKPVNRLLICLDFFINDSTASKLCHLEAQAYCFVVVVSGYCQLTRGDSGERSNSCARVECSSQSQLRCCSVKMRCLVSITLVIAFLQHGMGYTQERRYVEVSCYKPWILTEILWESKSNIHERIIFSTTVENVEYIFNRNAGAK